MLRKPLPLLALLIAGCGGGGSSSSPFAGLYEGAATSVVLDGAGGSVTEFEDKPAEVVVTKGGRMTATIAHDYTLGGTPHVSTITIFGDVARNGMIDDARMFSSLDGEPAVQNNDGGTGTFARGVAGTTAVVAFPVSGGGAGGFRFTFDFTP